MIYSIASECSEYLKLSNGKPLLKNLPKSYETFCKVKIRHKKNKKYKKSKMLNYFNFCFSDYYKDLGFKAMYAYPEAILEEAQDGYEPFYIFPINRFKFLYNPLVKSSYNEYNKIFSLLSQEKMIDVFSDIIKNNYKHENLENGILSNSEIIFYDIPYYYGLRKSLLDGELKYQNFLNSNS